MNLKAAVLVGGLVVALSWGGSPADAQQTGTQGQASRRLFRRGEASRAPGSRGRGPGCGQGRAR